MKLNNIERANELIGYLSNVNDLEGSIKNRLNSPDSSVYIGALNTNGERKVWTIENHNFKVGVLSLLEQYRDELKAELINLGVEL